MRNMKGGLVILVQITLLGVPAVASEPAPVTLHALLEEFNRMPGLEAGFREEKRIALLAAPLVSEGTLHFAPPARLARHTRTPESSSVLIDGRRLIFGDARAREEIDLDTNPIVRDYVNSFLLILKGDQVTLARTWRIDLSGDAGKWTMTLSPITEPIRTTIREMILEGSGTILKWVKVVETTGDETITTFSEVNPARRYSPDEVDRIFRIPPL